MNFGKRNNAEKKVANLSTIKVFLPVSRCFSSEDVKEFEKTINTCLNCSSSCKGKELAEYLAKIGLDEFKKQKADNCLPEEIRCLLHSREIATKISFGNHALIYGKL